MPGADLIGFVRGSQDADAVLAIGEVETSSDLQTPPGVMTKLLSARPASAGQRPNTRHGRAPGRRLERRLAHMSTGAATAIGAVAGAALGISSA